MNGWWRAGLVGGARQRVEASRRRRRRVLHLPPTPPPLLHFTAPPCGALKGAFAKAIAFDGRGEWPSWKLTSQPPKKTDDRQAWQAGFRRVPTTPPAHVECTAGRAAPPRPHARAQHPLQREPP